MNKFIPHVSQDVRDSCNLYFNSILIEEVLQKNLLFCFRKEINFDPDKNARENAGNKVVEALGKDWSLKASIRGLYQDDLLLINANGNEILHVDIENASIEIIHYSNVLCELNELYAVVHKACKKYLKKNIKTEVGINFWFAGSEGPTRIYKSLTCPTWDEISNNYPDKNKIKWLTTLKNPWDKGKIIFWNGHPGTGKTYAIRALMQAWRNMIISVVIDQERFFEDAEFMYRVLLNKEYNDEFTTGFEKLKEKQGNLIILEDTVSLVLQSSRVTMGGHMAKLLNISDGLIGQGMKCCFIITTNENFDRIDPAITRPGRQLQTLEFSLMDRRQSESWLKTKGFTGVLPKGDKFSLAELYAIFDPTGVEKAEITVKRVGF